MLAPQLVRLRSHLVLAIVTVVAFAGGVLAWPYSFELRRVYINWNPYTLAQHIVNEGRSPDECWNLVVLDPFGPQPAQLRAGCVYQVAMLTLNPSVCELLLPSDYGLECLSTVGGKLFSGQPCYFTSRNEVYCNRNSPEGEVLLTKPEIGNCATYQRKDLREWCWGTRTWWLPGIHECGYINHPIVRYECEEGYAFKEKDASFCSAIQNEERKQYCEIRVSTWLKYPKLRDSSFFGKPPQIDS